MVLIDNKSMLDFFDENRILYYYTCENIANAGKEEYAIREISFYQYNSEQPCDEYASFTVNLFNDLVVYTQSISPAFLKEIFDKLKNDFSKYNEVRFGTPNISLFTSELFNLYFKIEKEYRAEYGVYASFSQSNISELKLPQDVRIEILSNLKVTPFSKYNDDNWDGLASQIQYGSENDLLFVLYEQDKVVGYLLANCSYKNIYDVSNVFVSESFRGRHYGTLLTIFYARYY